MSTSKASIRVRHTPVYHPYWLAHSGSLFLADSETLQFLARAPLTAARVYPLLRCRRACNRAPHAAKLPRCHEDAVSARQPDFALVEMCWSCPRVVMLETLD